MDRAEKTRGTEWEGIDTWSLTVLKYNQWTTRLKFQFNQWLLWFMLQTYKLKFAIQTDDHVLN